MKKAIRYSLLSTLCSLLTAALLPAQTARPYAWDAHTHPPQTARIQAWRGDTLPLAPRWGADTNGWTFTAYWQASGMGDAWWSKPSSDSGGVHAATGDPFLWTPDMDTGARAYRLFIQARAPGGALSYSANAEITMLESPGATPNALPLPVQTLDFSAVTVLNPPWITAADLPEPPEPPVTSVNGKTGAVTLAAADVSAVDAADTRYLRADIPPRERTVPGWGLNIVSGDETSLLALSGRGMSWTKGFGGGTWLSEPSRTIDADGVWGLGYPELGWAPFYAHPSGPSSPITTKADIAAAIEAHNNPGKNHPDIRAELAGKPSHDDLANLATFATLALADHNLDPLAHPDTVRSPSITTILEKTQAEYDALALAGLLDPRTLYIITEGQP